jgi:enoyl-CoA hydratase
MTAAQRQFEAIRVQQRGQVGLIVLDRPQALNALSSLLTSELLAALDQFEGADDIGCIVITGSERAFAAGADVREMASLTHAEVFQCDHLAQWDRVGRCRKPLIAAVAGYALGGGCELALMCDFILAADNAKFGLPEVTIGTIPGMGGTQRLTRLVGKSKAMEMVLTGRLMDAEEAERAQLVSRIVPLAELIDEALKTAERIASLSRPAVMMAKEAINRTYETTLTEGIRFERRLFHSTFATEDQKEGMSAFTEKRSPMFRNR